jgi:hypothetical protein
MTPVRPPASPTPNPPSLQLRWLQRCAGLWLVPDDGCLLQGPGQLRRGQVRCWVLSSGRQILFTYPRLHPWGPLLARSYLRKNVLNPTGSSPCRRIPSPSHYPLPRQCNLGCENTVPSVQGQRGGCPAQNKKNQSTISLFTNPGKGEGATS